MSGAIIGGALSALSGVLGGVAQGNASKDASKAQQKQLDAQVKLAEIQGRQANVAAQIAGKFGAKNTRVILKYVFMGAVAIGLVAVLMRRHVAVG